MRIAISNIAWDVEEDEDVARLLCRLGIDAIDVAPPKYFADPVNTRPTDIERVRAWWKQRGIEITGMQALLFGTTGLNLFGDPEVQVRMLSHLDAVCRIGAGLGATRLVFGSPRNRDRDGLSDSKAEEIAVEFFQRLGELALHHDVTICLEPNPRSYGCNFMTTSTETAKIVSELNHPAVKMQLDLGAMTINNEDPADVIRKYASLIGHVHLSEPQLKTLGDGPTDHVQIGCLLHSVLPRHVVSIEMLATRDESHLAAIERAVNLAQRAYGPPTGPDWASLKT